MTVLNGKWISLCYSRETKHNWIVLWRWLNQNQFFMSHKAKDCHFCLCCCMCITWQILWSKMTWYLFSLLCPLLHVLHWSVQTIVLQILDQSKRFLFFCSLVGPVVPGAPVNPEGRAQPIRNWFSWILTMVSDVLSWFTALFKKNTQQ